MSSYKSSFNSPRSSPFRRPASPSSPTPVRTPVTPPSQRGASPMTSPSKLRNSYIASEEDEEDSSISILTPSRASTEPPPSMRTHQTTTTTPTNTRRLPSPPQPQYANSPQPRTTTSSPRTFSSSQDALSRLPPSLLNSLRESFSVLDTTSDGQITPQSVIETLSTLGISSSSSASEFFPPGNSSTLSLPQYLNQLANILIHLSPPQELLNAFSAFDDDDSGQIDINELREALLHTAPDAGERPLSERDIDRAMEGFTGRRILGKGVGGIVGVRGMGSQTPMNKKSGDVFRYQEFVANLTAGPAQGGETQGQAVRAQ